MNLAVAAVLRTLLNAGPDDLWLWRVWFVAVLFAWVAPYWAIWTFLSPWLIPLWPAVAAVAGMLLKPAGMIPWRGAAIGAAFGLPGLWHLYFPPDEDGFPFD